MVQKQSKLLVADTCGVWFVKVFQIYRGFQHKHAHPGDFVKASVRSTKPNNFFKKGRKSKAVLIRATNRQYKRDGSFIRLHYNTCVLLRKRMTPRGKMLGGPITYGIKRRKFVSSFIGII